MKFCTKWHQKNNKNTTNGNISQSKRDTYIELYLIIYTLSESYWHVKLIPDTFSYLINSLPKHFMSAMLFLSFNRTTQPL